MRHSLVFYTTLLITNMILSTFSPSLIAGAISPTSSSHTSLTVSLIPASKCNWIPRKSISFLFSIFLQFQTYFRNTFFRSISALFNQSHKCQYIFRLSLSLSSFHSKCLSFPISPLESVFAMHLQSILDSSFQGIGIIKESEKLFQVRKPEIRGP